MGEVDRVICGDARDVLKTFPDNYFQTTITSPPYWLRSLAGLTLGLSRIVITAYLLGKG